MSDEERVANEPGVCPNCGKSNLSYHGSEPNGDQLAYNFTCEECGARGQEWYKLDFIETRVYE